MDCSRCVSPFRMKRALLTLDYIEAAKTPGGLAAAAAIRQKSEKWFGQRLAGLYAGHDLEALLTFFRAWPEMEATFGPEVEIRIKDCPFHGGLVSLGIAPAVIRELSDFLCLEEHLVQGFNPDLKLTLDRSLMRGEAYCSFRLWAKGKDLSERPEVKETCLAKVEARPCPAQTFGGLTARYALDLLALAKADPAAAREAEALRLRYDSARLSGQVLAARAHRTDLVGLKEYYWSKFPHVTCTLEGRKLVCHTTTCALFTGMKELGVEDLTGLSRIGCLADEAAIAGFNPNIVFQQDQNLLDGDGCCLWRFSMKMGENRP
ncbi:MAG: L-2-amino-thiazoline-4-carboxylic acid hydrolase [Thermodesulfobacteriota bacterium]